MSDQETNKLEGLMEMLAESQQKLIERQLRQDERQVNQETLTNNLLENLRDLIGVQKTFMERQSNQEVLLGKQEVLLSTIVESQHEFIDSQKALLTFMERLHSDRTLDTRELSDRKTVVKASNPSECSPMNAAAPTTEAVDMPFILPGRVTQGARPKERGAQLRTRLSKKRQQRLHKPEDRLPSLTSLNLDSNHDLAVTGFDTSHKELSRHRGWSLEGDGNARLLSCNRYITCM